MEQHMTAAYNGLTVLGILTFSEETDLFSDKITSSW